MRRRHTLIINRNDVTAVEVATKTCTACGETKPLSEFHRDRRAKDGRHTQCKPCVNAAVLHTLGVLP